MVVHLWAQILLERLGLLGKVVLHRVEKVIVGVLGHARVADDQGAVLDQRFCGLYSVGVA